MKYTAIIFDMDGTIVDTGGIWESATEKLIAKKGIRLSDTQRNHIFTQSHGLQLHPSCSLLKDLLQLPDDIHTLVSELAALGDLFYKEGVRFIDGFPEFHEKVVAHNLKSGVATNAVDSTLHITKEALKLEKFFGHHIYNISHVNNKGKPHPDIYLHAAAQLGCKPIHCVAIEDSAHGIKAAKAAGMFCIGINTSKNPAQLKEADLVIDGYHEIDLPRLLNLKN